MFADVVNTAPRMLLRADDESYPKAVLEAYDKPPELHVLGNPLVAERPCISIIGARKATPYGLAAAMLAGRVAAECGIVVVSGGARGCDFAAAKAALDAGGTTIVVPGCGADHVYPASSVEVFEGALRSGGCIMSLEAWGSEPRKHAFPKRNGIIAALGQSLLVAEAGLPSGTFSTASAAFDYGKDVYAIPGSIWSPTCKGTNLLIEQGAAIICDECALETRISLDYSLLRMRSPHAEKSHDELMAALIASPMTPEHLAESLGIPVLELLRELTTREAAGLVERLADGRYSPSVHALIG